MHEYYRARWFAASIAPTATNMQMTSHFRGNVTCADYASYSTPGTVQAPAIRNVSSSILHEGDSRCFAFQQRLQLPRSNDGTVLPRGSSRSSTCMSRGRGGTREDISTDSSSEIQIPERRVESTDPPHRGRSAFDRSRCLGCPHGDGTENSSLRGRSCSPMDHDKCSILRAFSVRVDRGS